MIVAICDQAADRNADQPSGSADRREPNICFVQ